MSGEDDSSSSSSDDDLDLMVENVTREDAQIIAAEPEPEPAKPAGISNEDLEADGGDERAKTPSVDGSLYSADDAGADADGDAGAELNEEIAALEAELGVDGADADKEQAATREREEKMQKDARQKEAERERREQEKAAREAERLRKAQDAEERKQKREQEKAIRKVEKRRKAQEAEERKARKAEEKAAREAERRQKAQEVKARKEQQQRDRAAAILAFDDDAFPPPDEYNDTDAGALQLAATESVAYVPEERKYLLQRFLGEHPSPRRKPKASLGVLRAGGDGNDRDILDLLGPSDDDDEDDDDEDDDDKVWLTDAAKVLEMVQYTTRHTARSDIPFLFPYDAGAQSFVSAEAKDASMQEAMRHAARLIIGAFGLRHRADQQPDLLLVWRLLVEGRVASPIPCTLELFRSDPDFYTAITTLIKGADLQVYDGNLTRSLQHLNLPEEKVDRLVFWNGLSRQRRLDMVEHTIEALEQGRVQAVDAQMPLFRLVSYYNPLESVSVNQLVTLTLVMHEILHGAHGLFTTELPGFTEDETLDLLDLDRKSVV